ncbi:Aste57867_578 [Aphanomyces stellatus]|uniref:Aste57867_578 protein n=1 Tax=Aphanomyces stellatus TaxID=120398 RepID=A0A485K457_9STRA|nr:hypothetical protein As57867_000577 [Aphanomyces stellatus]VFT77803.1 Aste57867_578 [Aphanomyces stellatus]
MYFWPCTSEFLEGAFLHSTLNNKSLRGGISIMGFKITNFNVIFVLLCAITTLNYIDRGIIPGAPVQFQAFIQDAHGVDRSHVSVYFGILVSAFIASYSIFICVFGYLSTTHRPFLLIAIGLAIWIVAILLCGLAKPLQSFDLLLLGRILSGIGESSFEATTPPFLDEFAPANTRTLYLGTFYSAKLVGTAIGYVYGGAVASVWDVGFWATAIVMLPMAYACWQCIPFDVDCPLSKLDVARLSAESMLSIRVHMADDDDPSHGAVATTPPSPSVLTRVIAVVQDPLFTTTTLAGTAITFTLSGLSAFAPAFLIGYGILDESVASLGVGAVAALAGILGAPLGGWLVDRQTRGRAHDEAFRAYVSASMMTICTVLSAGISFLSLACMDSAALYLIALFLSLLTSFMSQAPMMQVTLYSLPKSQRGLGVGIHTLLVHVLGDVPSPIVLGALKDAWAPHCGSIWNDKNEQQLDPACHVDRSGLRHVLAFAYAWLLWAVLACVAAFAIARRRLGNPHDTNPRRLTE